MIGCNIYHHCLMWNSEIIFEICWISPTFSLDLRKERNVWKYNVTSCCGFVLSCFSSAFCKVTLFCCVSQDMCTLPSRTELHRHCLCRIESAFAFTESCRQCSSCRFISDCFLFLSFLFLK